MIADAQTTSVAARGRLQRAAQLDGSNPLMPQEADMYSARASDLPPHPERIVAANPRMANSRPACRLADDAVGRWTQEATSIPHHRGTDGTGNVIKRVRRLHWRRRDPERLDRVLYWFDQEAQPHDRDALLGSRNEQSASTNRSGSRPPAWRWMRCRGTRSSKHVGRRLQCAGLEAEAVLTDPARRQRT